jgi:hypothetical protein
MAITLEEFQEVVLTRRRDRKHGARRYDEGLVSFAVQHAQTVVTRGGSVHAAAKELGISMMTLQSWQRRVGGSPRAGRLRKVVVSSPTPSAAVAVAGALTLTTSAGHIVSGLDVAQVAALLRALP